MAKVKDYKGVTIYVQEHTGEFYCDVVNNSSNYKDKTYNSAKLSSLEKAITNHSEGVVMDGEVFYEVYTFRMTCKRLKVIRVVGNRVFFNDGTDSLMEARKHLYSEQDLKVNHYDVFKTLEENNAKYAELQKQINVLAKQMSEIQKETDKMFSNTKSLKKTTIAKEIGNKSK